MPPRYLDKFNRCIIQVNAKTCVDILKLLSLVAHSADEEKIVLLGERNCELSTTLVEYIEAGPLEAELQDIPENRPLHIFPEGIGPRRGLESRYHPCDPNVAYNALKFLEYARKYHGESFGCYWAAAMYNKSFVSGPELPDV